MTDDESCSDNVRSQAVPDDPPQAHHGSEPKGWAGFVKRRWPTLGGVVAVVVVGAVGRALGEDLELYILAWGESSS